MKTPILFAAFSSALVQFSAASVPQATNRGPYEHELFNIAPAPTAVPRELELKARVLGVRQASGSSAAAASSYSSGPNSKTCGYYDGMLSEPLDCGTLDDADTDYECASKNDYWGCCPVSAGTFVWADCPSVNNPYTGCYPYSLASACTGACFYGNRICESTLPYCGTGLLTTGSNTYTAYYCNSYQADAVWTIQATATIDDLSSSTAPSSSQSISSTSRSITSSSSRTSSSSSSLTLPTANSNVISSTSSTGPSKGSTGTAAGQSSTGTASPTPKKNVGAIAGGVVGGVVGLAIIIGGIAYMLHRKKVNERRQSRLEISQVQ